MGTDVAAFAKQLKKDGIDAAKQEAEKILAQAREEADKIVSDAKVSAEKLDKESQLKIAQHRQRSEAEMKLVARDLINSLRARIQEIASALFQAETAKALDDKKVLKNVITEIIKTHGKTSKTWEVSINEKSSKEFSDYVLQLFKEKDAKATVKKELKKSGFELSEKKGSEVIEVTEESITEAFKGFLSAELKKIFDSENEGDK